MKRNSKRFLSIVLIASAVCLFLCGCDPYGGKYPDLDEDEIWICDEALLFFRGFNEELGYPPGGVIVDGQMKEIRADFLYGGFLLIIEKGKGANEPLLDGECSFKKDLFTVKELSKDKLFNFQYETLTFRLYYEDDVDWVDGWPVPGEGQRR